MSEAPRRIFSDGMVEKLSQDRDHFIGKSIDELFSILVDKQGRLASKYCWVIPTQSLT